MLKSTLLPREWVNTPRHPPMIKPSLSFIHSFINALLACLLLLTSFITESRSEAPLKQKKKNLDSWVRSPDTLSRDISLLYLPKSSKLRKIFMIWPVQQLYTDWFLSLTDWWLTTWSGPVRINKSLHTFIDFFIYITALVLCSYLWQTEIMPKHVLRSNWSYINTSFTLMRSHKILTFYHIYYKCLDK